jgi:hypothetical protein
MAGRKKMMKNSQIALTYSLNQLHAGQVDALLPAVLDMAFKEEL